MDLAAKLQLKPGHRLRTVDAPDSVASILPALEGDDAALLVFVTSRAALESLRSDIVESASLDRLTWVAYPKAGQLGTDLNRDSLAAVLIDSGVQPVRQVALDAVWSALRFRPGPAA